MSDIRKTIDDLQLLNALCHGNALDDAIELLKEHEKEIQYRTPKKITHNATKIDYATCPSCGNIVGETQIMGDSKVLIQWKYCKFCGQELDWEMR